MGKRIFHNENDRSVIKLAFPLSLLKEPDVKERYENWLLWLCDTFEVESGCAELSFVLPYAFEQMFPYEYATGSAFFRRDGGFAGYPCGEAVEGLKGACW